MDKATENDESQWLNPQLFVHFMDELREAGYSIGVNQYIAVQDLLLTLATQGELHELKQLKSLIGPIVCSSFNEQVDFQQRFDQWADLVSQDQYNPPQTVTKKAEELSEVLKKLQKRSDRLQRFLVVSTVTILAGVFFHVPRPFDETILLEQENPQTQVPPITVPEPAPAPVPEAPAPLQVPETPQGLSSRSIFSAVDWQIYLLLPPLALAIWHFWWQRHARLFLHRFGGNQNLELQKISIQNFDVAVFSPILISNIAQQLRYRNRKPSNRLDIDRMIQVSIERGGWLTPVYGYKKIIPEYLFLIDRVGYQDHQAKLIEDLIKRLQQNDIYTTHYFFDGNAQICYPESQVNTPESLNVLADRHADDRLVVIAEAEKFFRRQTGESESWVELIQEWEKRAILTPKTFENWGQWELKLAKDFVVLPLNGEGLDALACFFKESSATYQFSPRSQALFPEMLSTRPQRWLDRASPSSEEIQAMLSNLAAYLGETAFYWFASCAIFPELNWNITIYLGATLKTAKGESLIDVCSIADITRLPWFRYGYIPDWLRSSLISKLTTEQSSMARSALQELLITAIQGATSSVQLEIVKQHHKSLSRLANPLLYRSSRQATEDSSFRDYIFLGFMVRQPKLAIKATDNLNQLVQRYDNHLWSIGGRILSTAILAFGTFTTAIIAFRDYDISKFSMTLIQQKALRIIFIVSLFSGMTTLGLRQIGIFQTLELRGFDQLMQLRPRELPDPRILIITVTESDILYQDDIQAQRRSGSSLSDFALSKLLEKLEPMQPGVIGLDIFRDYPVSTDQPELQQQLQTMDKLFAVCSVDPNGIYPPPEVPQEQVGFSDLVIDADGVVRRQLLFVSPNATSPCQADHAWSTLIAMKYLIDFGIKGGIDDKSTSDGHLKLGNTIFTRLNRNSGGYKSVDAYGFQIFLNYRNLKSPNQIAAQVTLKEFLDNQVQPEQVKDRIVLIGVATASQDRYITPYSQRGAPGVVIHAQMISNLLSAILEERPLIRFLPDWAEFLWVLSWASMGAALAYEFSLRPNSKFLLGKLLLGGLTAEINLLAICWLILVTTGYCFPWIPSAISIIFTAGGIAIYAQTSYFRSQ